MAIELLGKRKFSPFFFTQFGGAFNDNLFKNSITNLITFQAVLWVPLWMDIDTNVLVNVGAMVFILPYFLFSASAGQLADKFEKSMLIRRIKLLEIAIMCFAVFALWTHELISLFVLLFLMGTQSTLFSPVKYSYMPQYLSREELVGGNGLVEMGTFVAILLGTIYAGVLTGMGEPGLPWIMGSVVMVAVLGWLASCAIPEGPAASPDLKLRFNPIPETRAIMRIASSDRVVFLAIMGISWFWAYGSIYMAQIFGFTRDALGGNESVIIVMLAAFSVGIGGGSVLCEYLSGRRIELAMVPLGAAGMLYFGLHLPMVDITRVSLEIGLWPWLLESGSWRIVVDLFGTGFSGGLFIVTLYALVQQRSPVESRARVIAANNVWNSLFMVLASAYAIVALQFFGMSIEQLFIATALMHIAVCIFIFTLVPEFVMRLLVYIVVNTLYRIRTEGLEKIPEEGPCLVVINHVSFIDALVVGGIVRRPVVFVMDHQIYNLPVLNFIFRTARCIPICSKKVDPKMLADAYETVSERLAQGHVVAIFPEGQITRTGEMNEFRTGIEKILQRNPVPVVPMALRGLWGSFFSRYYGTAMAQLPRRFWSRIELVVGDPVPPQQATSEEMAKRVLALRGDWQ